MRVEARELGPLKNVRTSGTAEGQGSGEWGGTGECGAEREALPATREGSCGRQVWGLRVSKGQSSPRIPICRLVQDAASGPGRQRLGAGATLGAYLSPHRARPSEARLMAWVCTDLSSRRARTGEIPGPA